MKKMSRMANLRDMHNPSDSRYRNYSKEITLRRPVALTSQLPPVADWEGKPVLEAFEG
jgi:hypothetical protein